MSTSLESSWCKALSCETTWLMIVAMRLVSGLCNESSNSLHISLDNTLKNFLGGQLFVHGIVMLRESKGVMSIAGIVL